MKNSIATIILLLLIWILGLSQCSRERINSDISLAEFTACLDKRIPAVMQQYKIPGTTVALIKEGRTVWTKAYGYADLANGRKMTTDTYCRVESISKSVTAWGVLRLVQEGAIRLDDPVVTYLKSWEFPKSGYPTNKITIRQLLSHSSGMPLGTIGVRYEPAANKPSLRESLNRDAYLFREPGTSFSYSNTGFNLLELVIEEVTGQDFATYMQEEVLIPLGMNQSSFRWSPNFKPEVPYGYDLNGMPIPVYVYPDKAAGGLFATVDDIARFLSAGMPKFNNIGGNVLNANAIETLYSPSIQLNGYYALVFDAYGLGHFIETLPNGMRSVSHGGQGSGWMTHFQSMPESGDGIVIITNSQRSWPFFGQIISEWGRWVGFGSLGMGKIVWATRALRILVILAFVVALWKFLQWTREIYQGCREFAPRTKKSALPGVVQTVLSLLLFYSIWWMLSRDYFFLFSVFPKDSTYLLLVMFMTAIGLLLFAMFPKSVKCKG